MTEPSQEGLPMDKPGGSSPIAASAAVIALLIAGGCHSPKDSQQYFLQAALKDPALEPVHQTALYTIYYDYALRRCVLHAAHTWGEDGGGSGGTGIGVHVFRCDPARIKARYKQVNMGIEDLKIPPAGRSGRKPGPPRQPAGEGGGDVPAAGEGTAAAPATGSSGAGPTNGTER